MPLPLGGSIVTVPGVAALIVMTDPTRPSRCETTVSPQVPGSTITVSPPSTVTRARVIVFHGEA